jgi:hypothetical protein
MGKRRRRQAAVAAEFAELDLGDERRDRRGQRIAARLALVPDGSLPVAMGSEANLEAAYRHLSNDRVDLPSVLLPHVENTKERVTAAGTAYVAHDTTDFVFGGTGRREGLGHVNSANDQGFRAHVSLAIATDGITPLGVLAIGTCARTDEETTKESARWQQGIEVAEAPFDDTRGLVHIADRESDIYALMADCVAAGRRFIFRAAQDRAIEEDGVSGASLFEAVASSRTRLKRTVPLSARPKKKDCPPAQRKAFPVRRSRQAELHFSARQVTLRRPHKASRSLPAHLTVNAVRVWEPNPPADEPGVEWILLTSEPIRTRTQIAAVVDGYRARWLIEMYFQALKTGCGFERRQLESAHALENLLGYCLVVAYSMLVLRAVARDSTNLPISSVFTARQIRCLTLMTEGAVTSESTAHQALLKLASLGGHLKSNGPPGWRTLSRGWRKLLEFEDAYVVIKGLERCDQS